MSAPLYQHPNRRHQSVQSSQTLVRQRQDEIADICQDFEQLDAAMGRPKQKRPPRWKKPNELKSTTASVPPEILSYIFQFVCPPSEYNTTHTQVRKKDGKLCRNPVFILCEVSSRWRQIAISTAQLWWKLELSPTKRGICIESWVGLVQIYAARAGDCLLDLQLSDLQLGANRPSEFEKSPKQWGHPDHPKLRLNQLEHAIFVQHAHKLRRLSLPAHEPLKKLIQLLLNSFTQLRELRLHFLKSSRNTQSVLDLQGLPHLHTLAFDDVQHKLLLPWTQITVVSLRRARGDVCWEILSQCPNLIEFHHRFPLLSVEDTMSEDTTYHPVTLEHLDFFEWTCVNTPLDTVLLQNLHLPSLRRFSWLEDDKPISQPIYKALLEFLELLPLSFATFDIGFSLGWEFPPLRSDRVPFLQSIFATIPRVRRLTIVGFTWACTLETTFRSLKPMRGSFPLPALESLRVKSHHATAPFVMIATPPVGGDGVTNEAAPVLEFLERRRTRLQVPSFRLVLCGVIQWDSETKNGIQKLVREGLKLEMAEGYVPSRVHWLR